MAGYLDLLQKLQKKGHIHCTLTDCAELALTTSSPTVINILARICSYQYEVWTLREPTGSPNATKGSMIVTNM